MAVARTMLAVAREEAVLLTAEVAATVRTALTETAGTGAAVGSSAAGAARVEAVNPLAVRTAMEVAAKEAGGAMGGTGGIMRSVGEVATKEGIAGESILSQHLALAPKPTLGPNATTLSTLLTESSLSSTGSTSRLATGLNGANGGARSIITEAIQQDAGATLREVMSNSVQTGVEEQMDQVADVARQLAPEVIKEVEGVVGKEGLSGVKEMAAAVREVAAELQPAK